MHKIIRTIHTIDHAVGQSGFTIYMIPDHLTQESPDFELHSNTKNEAIFMQCKKTQLR